MPSKKSATALDTGGDSGLVYAMLAYALSRVMGNYCLNSSCQLLRNLVRQTHWHAGILGI
jgi:hypothetical protein